MRDIYPLTQIIARLLSQQQRVVIAIDGPSGSGKTTLAGQLARVYRGNLYHVDDFFLSGKQRQQVDRSHPGWNADHARLRREVLQPLSRAETICYRAFNCQTQRFKPSVYMPARHIEIVEGAYSSHPQHREHYDLKIFLSIDSTQQERRILSRNGPEGLQRFLSRWIPLENAYFAAHNIAEQSDIIL